MEIMAHNWIELLLKMSLMPTVIHNLNLNLNLNQFPKVECIVDMEESQGQLHFFRFILLQCFSKTHTNKHIKKICSVQMQYCGNSMPRQIQWRLESWMKWRKYATRSYL